MSPRPALLPPARASLVPAMVPQAASAPDAERELLAMAAAVQRYERAQHETIPSQRRRAS